MTATIREIRQALFEIDEEVQDSIPVEAIFVNGDGLRIQIKGAAITVPMGTPEDVYEDESIPFEEFVKGDAATTFVTGKPGMQYTVNCRSEHDASIVRGRFQAAATRQGVGIKSRTTKFRKNGQKRLLTITLL